MINNIKTCFDQAYENDVNKIRKLKGQYQSLKDRYCNDYIEKDSFINEQKKLLTQDLFNKLASILDKNLNQIEKKVAQPDLPISLSLSMDCIDEINRFIEENNRNIEKINARIANREQEKEKLKDYFWKALRKEYDPIIKNYNEMSQKLEQEKNNINEKIQSVKECIRGKESLIQKNQGETINIDKVIDEINRQLLDFGIQDFEIMKLNNEEYKISREGVGEDIFQSLSEGEKTVISFLYFLELCNGKVDRKDTKNKIIVIDDPISSLSHMYVFNVAELIKKYFWPPVKPQFIQIFILTHNLYFFNELVDKKKYKNNQSLFRIKKSSFSTIQKMEKNEIQNEYQSYWTIIKDGNQTTNVLVANVMRNILEYFFGFIEKSESINNVFKKGELSDAKYKAFKRHINRESHSTPTNIFDNKEFNYEYLQETFKKIFEVTKYLDHYKKMME